MTLQEYAKQLVDLNYEINRIESVERELQKKHQMAIDAIMKPLLAEIERQSAPLVMQHEVNMSRLNQVHAEFSYKKALLEETFNRHRADRADQLTWDAKPTESSTTERMRASQAKMRAARKLHAVKG